MPYKSERFSDSTLHHDYACLGHGELDVGGRSGTEKVLHATKVLRYLQFGCYASIPLEELEIKVHTAAQPLSDPRRDANVACDMKVMQPFRCMQQLFFSKPQPSTSFKLS